MYKINTDWNCNTNLKTPCKFWGSHNEVEDSRLLGWYSMQTSIYSYPLPEQQVPPLSVTINATVQSVISQKTRTSLMLICGNKMPTRCDRGL